MAGLASPLPAAVSRLLLLHGAVVRLCVCRVKILLLDGAAVSLGDSKAGRLIGRYINITLRGTNIKTLFLSGPRPEHLKVNADQ